MATSNAGRTPKYQEKLSERIVVYVTPSQLEQLKERATGGDISSYARQRFAIPDEAIRDEDAAALPDQSGPADANLAAALAGTNQFRGPLLSPVACGPWREPLDDARSFALSHDTAEFLEVRDGDFFLPAQGQSMEGAGIQDGYLVVVRPLDGKIPRRNEIVLVEVTTEDGTTVYTLKHWGPSSAPGAPPLLIDGAGDQFPLPGQAQQLQPIGRAIAVLGRL